MKLLKVLMHLAVATIFIGGCKKNSTPQSNAKTIDNFARVSGEVQTNACSGTLKFDLVNAVQLAKPLDQTMDPAAKNLLAGFVEGALGNIPPNLMKHFFETSGGTIRLVENANTECALLSTQDERRYWSERSNQTDACWKMVEAKPVIIVTANPKAIRHHLVRMLGRLVVELFLPAAVVNADSADKESIDILSRGVAGLSAAFIRELSDPASNQKSGLSLESFKDMLRPGNAMGRALFDRQLFAEAFDSYYCTTDEADPTSTRSIFKRLVPESYQILESTINRLSGGLALADPVPSNGYRTITSKDRLPDQFVGMRVPVDNRGNLQPVEIDSTRYYRGRENDARFPDLKAYASTLESYQKVNPSVSFHANNGNWAQHPEDPKVFQANDPYWNKALRTNQGPFFDKNWAPSPVAEYQAYNAALNKRDNPSRGYLSSLFGG